MLLGRRGERTEGTTQRDERRQPQGEPAAEASLPEMEVHGRASLFRPADTPA